MRTPSDTPPPFMMVLAEMTNGQTITYWHGLDTLAQSDGTNVSYFEYDGLGSVRQVVDDAGEVGLSQTFDPYGNPYASTGSASTSLGFTGEQTDSNGFVFLRARYYNPSAGRFFQTDPSRQEKNPYQYAAGNPVMLTDLTGLDPHWCEEIIDPVEKRICYANSSGKVPIPLVDQQTGRISYKDDWYGLREHRSESVWLGSWERRQKALDVAYQWADDWAGNLPWGDTTPPQGSEAGCNDCIKFISYVLWSAGFRMTGVTFTNGVATFSDYYTGWWAKSVQSDTTPGVSSDFETVDEFVSSWTGEKGYPARAHLTSDISSLQPGDLILYRWLGDLDSDFDHAAMVVQPGVRPQIASRGAWDTQEITNPKTGEKETQYICGPGKYGIDYKDDDWLLANVTFESATGLRIDY